MIGRIKLLKKITKFGYKRFGAPGAVAFALGGLILYIFARKRLESIVNSG